MRARWTGPTAAALIFALCSCSSSKATPSISNLRIYPESATLDENWGSAAVLGVFDGPPLDAPGPCFSYDIRVDGTGQTPDFFVCEGTTYAFGARIPTSGLQVHSISVDGVLFADFPITDDLDRTFGTGGFAIRDDLLEGEEARAVAIQPDGRIVVGGLAQGPLLERYQADGSVDTSFAGSGRLVDAASWNEVRAVALQSDGKILAAGTGPAEGFFPLQATVRRLLEDGSTDLDFGAAGSAVVPFTAGSSAYGLLVQPDGKVVLVGSMNTDDDTCALVARLTPEGALDPEFATGGVFVFSGAAGGWDQLFGAALDGDGRLVVTGSSSGAEKSLPQLLVLRLTPEGTLDPTFASGGEFHFSLLYDTGRGVGIQPGGRIVVGGDAWSYASNANVALAIGLTPEGTLDPTFADQGVFWSRPLLPYGMLASAFALSQAGEVVLVGARYLEAELLDAAILRLTPDGELDRGFSVDGLSAVVTGSMSTALAVAVQRDGKVVVAGTSKGGVLLARMLAPPVP